MKIASVFRERARFCLQSQLGFLGNWKIPFKTSLLIVSTLAMLAPGMSVKAEIIMGIIETYNPQKREATISLGEQDGIGKYDRGKIELTSLDSPNVKFVGANIVVVKVEDNFAVVSVREAPGVPVPIKTGARVTVDTDSGIARREEEAKTIAAEQAEAARRQQQLEAARAEQERQRRAAEQARAEQERQQQELAAARAAEQARQQQEAQARAAEEARQQQESESTALNDAKDLWQSGSNTDPEATASDLPLDYLQAYNNAREQPSPETYYRFAQVLINYEISKEALAWLEETRSRYPATAGINNLYRAVVLSQQGKNNQSQRIIETANISDNQIDKQFSSYIATQQGQWSEILSLSRPQESPSIYNNYLIALYCDNPLRFERETDLSPKPCPFGEAASKPVKNASDDDEVRVWNDDEIDDDEEDDDEKQERLQAENESKRLTLQEAGQEAIAAYPEDPYILNTLGFIALQAEDYEQAYKHYQQLANVLDKYDSTPPRLQLLKANAIKYVNNYNQNYEFLAENGQDLESLRSRQDSVSDAILIGGAGTAITSAVSGDASAVGLIGGVLSTLLRFNQSQSKSKDISSERNSIADQMHTTFTQDIDLVATPPDLDPKTLLASDQRRIKPNRVLSEPKSEPIESNQGQVKPNSTPNEPKSEPIESDSAEVEQRMRQFDEFWDKNKNSSS
ncbi:MAG: hypothetical protein AAF383_10810 [Cyanobacteria bacterium P01_A01_bin.83]